MDVNTYGIESAISGLDFDFLGDYALMAVCFAAFIIGWRKTVSGLALFSTIDYLSDGDLSASEKYLPVLVIGLVVLLFNWIKTKKQSGKAKRQPTAEPAVETIPEKRVERQTSAERMLAKIGK